MSDDAGQMTTIRLKKRDRERIHMIRAGQELPSDVAAIRWALKAVTEPRNGFQKKSGAPS